MIAGIDFPSLFTKDNFISRRTTGHNLHDPESLITGAEINAGLTYTNSAREWDSQATYLSACLGLLRSDEITTRAPRVLLNRIPESMNGMVIEDFTLGVL